MKRSPLRKVSNVAHERVGALRCVVAHIPSWNQLRIRVNRYPRPNVASARAF